MKPDVKEILQDATRLKDEKFGLRDAELKERHQYRHRKMPVTIPDAYKDTATEYRSPLIDEEGKQVSALIYAEPVPTVVPPTPSVQPLTTKIESFLMGSFQQLEAANGAIWWKNTQAQVHQKLGVVYCGMKRDAYSKGPTAPDDNDDIAELLSFKDKRDTYMRDEGIVSAFDYRHVPTETFYYRGDVRNPLCVFEIKEVDERDLMLQYGLKKGSDGKLSKPDDLTTMPSGYAQNEGNNRGVSKKLKVIEYWDRQWCILLVENGTSWNPNKKSNDALELDSWEHNWGRVPYFCAPAFENESLDEETKFSGPLDGLYAEIGEYNNRRTMMSNVAYLMGYPTWQAIQKDGGDQILDDSGQPKAYLKPKPGEVMQMAPGQEVAAFPMQTGPELLQELISIESRMKQFSLSDVSKGVSPGADTANAALTQLRRLQRSALSPLNENQARQAREMFRFMLARIKGEEGEGIGETVYVYDQSEGDTIDLSPDDIVTMNLQVKSAPDTGQDNLIEEKQAAELTQLGLITELEFHERRGKENPEEYVKANFLERLRRVQEQTFQQQILAALGDTQAIAQLIAASQETGDAKNAIPNIMQQIQAMQGHQNTGIGTGSPDMARAQGVRSPATLTNTQPGQFAENGVA